MMIPSRLFKVSSSLQRSLVQNIRLRPMSVQAPTFSSSGDTDSIVTRLGPNRISTMIITGKPNRPLPPSYNVDLEEFLPGAISAVSEVTSKMAEDDWDSLSGLLEQRCISSLRPVISSLSPEERELTKLNSEDVFLSFISNPENCESGNDFHIVTFSLPQLGEAKSLGGKNIEVKNNANEAIKAKMKAYKEEKEQGPVDKDAVKEDISGIISEYQKQVKDNDAFSLLSKNEIIIGNYRMQRDTPADDWTVTEVAQMSSVKAWHPIFRLRWKGRLSIATRGGWNFYTILRFDYGTDYIFLMACLAVLFADIPTQSLFFISSIVYLILVFVIPSQI